MSLQSFQHFQVLSLPCIESRLPPLPQQWEDIVIEGRWQKTLSGEQFFLQQEGDGCTDKILIFATNKNLHLLAEAESIYVTLWMVLLRFVQDFSSKYSQLMLLFKANSFLLCMVCYLGSQETYIIDFYVYKSRNFEMWSSHLSCRDHDFDLPLVQSLELQFPGACIQGCYFHFTQCLWRKVQSLGLVEEYKEDGSISCRQFIQKSAAIALCHPILFVLLGMD